MGSVINQVVKNIGTSSVLALASKVDRKTLKIVNKHATQTVRVKFGSGVVGDVVEVQKLAFSSVPDAGSYKVRWNGVDSGAIAFDDDAAAVQVALRLVTGLSAVTVTGDTTVGFSVTMTGVKLGVDADLPLLTTNTNTLLNGATAVTIAVTETTKGLFADGITVAAAGGTLSYDQPDNCPIDAIYMLASGADTRVEILEG